MKSEVIQFLKENDMTKEDFSSIVKVVQNLNWKAKAILDKEHWSKVPLFQLKLFIPEFNKIKQQFTIGTEIWFYQHNNDANAEFVKPMIITEISDFMILTRNPISDDFMWFDIADLNTEFFFSKDEILQYLLNMAKEITNKL